MFRNVAVCLFILFSPIVVWSQAAMVTLSGKVKDAAANGLEAASVVVEIDDLESKPYFLKTDATGFFSLSLPEYKKVILRVSYLGFEKFEKLIALTDLNEHLDIVLTGSMQLEEVVVDYQYQPIVIKKDTLVFDAASFMDGTERKLQDVLKNLPGVEVKNGQVRYQGTPIMNTRVENRAFFGGNTRLAIENIPSDAVSKIEVISHFSEVDFMKDALASDDMAMNITLKDTHKDLFFGDLEAAVGTEKSVQAHAALFAYHPAYSMQFIGDWNNTGKAFFSLMDLIQLQGGAKFINAQHPIVPSGMMSLTEVNRNHKTLNQQFAATSYQKVWNKKWDLSAYGIFSRISSLDYTVNSMEYLLLAGENKEQRQTSSSPQTAMGWLNLRIDYKPTNFELFSYTMTLQLGRQRLQSSYNSQFGLTSRSSIVHQKMNPVQFQQQLTWNKKINPRNTIASTLNIYRQLDEGEKYLGTDDFLFSTLLPVDTLAYYGFHQRRAETVQGLNFHLQHYHSFNRFHQLSPLLQLRAKYTDLTDAYDLNAAADTLMSLGGYGFGNSLKYRELDALLGFQYKFEWQAIVAKLLVAGSAINQQLLQDYGHAKNNDFVFTPKIELNYKFSEVSRLNTAYEQSFGYPSLRYINGSYELVSFNTLYRGLPTLNTERYRTFSSNFRNYVLKKTNFWAYFYYTQKSRSYRNTAVIVDQSQLLQSLIVQSPERNVSFSFMYERSWKYFSPFVGFSTTLASYLQQINEASVKTKQEGGTAKIGVKLLGDKLPSLGFTYEKSINQFKGFANSTFYGDKVLVDLRYVLFEVLRIQGNYEFYKNKHHSNKSSMQFAVLRGELAYQRRQKPWAITLTMENLLATKERVSNSFSNYLASEQRMSVLPRQILIGVQYKL